LSLLHTAARIRYIRGCSFLEVWEEEEEEEEVGVDGEGGRGGGSDNLWVTTLRERQSLEAGCTSLYSIGSQNPR